MNEPTGKLKHAYQTIANMELEINRLKGMEHKITDTEGDSITVKPSRYKQDWFIELHTGDAPYYVLTISQAIEIRDAITQLIDSINKNKFNELNLK